MTIRYRNRLLATTFTLILALLAACAGGLPPGPELLAAPGFADESGRLARAWQFGHHATTDSYRLTVVDGIATIERTGPEPWSRLTQTVDGDALAGLGGRWLAFSVDLRAALDNGAYGQPLESSGLMVTIEQEVPDKNLVSALLGARTTWTERLDLAADAQIVDWQRHRLEFHLPEDVSRLEVGFVMASGGLIELRNPALTLIDE